MPASYPGRGMVSSTLPLFIDFKAIRRLQKSAVRRGCPGRHSTRHWNVELPGATPTRAPKAAAASGAHNSEYVYDVISLVAGAIPRAERRRCARHTTPNTYTMLFRWWPGRFLAPWSAAAPFRNHPKVIGRCPSLAPRRREKCHVSHRHRAAGGEEYPARLTRSY